MVVLRFNIRNVQKVEKFIRLLPSKFDKEFTRSNQRFMSNIRDDARLNAPKDTGSLKESIELEPVRKSKDVKIWKIVVNSPYALFQEEGFTPHSFFAGTGFNSSKMAPGRTYFVSKWTPFLGPAVSKALTKLDNKLNSASNRALQS